MVEHLSVGLDREIDVREEESLMFDETKIFEDKCQWPPWRANYMLQVLHLT